MVGKLVFVSFLRFGNGGRRVRKTFDWIKFRGIIGTSGSEIQ